MFVRPFKFKQICVLFDLLQAIHLSHQNLNKSKFNRHETFIHSIILAFAGVLSLNAQNRTFSQIPPNYTLDVNSVSETAAEFVLPNTNPCFTDSLPSLFTYGGGYYGEKQKAQLYYLDPATYAGATIDSVKQLFIQRLTTMYLRHCMLQFLILIQQRVQLALL